MYIEPKNFIKLLRKLNGAYARLFIAAYAPRIDISRFHSAAKEYMDINKWVQNKLTQKPARWRRLWGKPGKQEYR